MQDRPLKILLASSEVVPFAKTGGLADVAGSLPKALAVAVNDDCLINDVRVVMPFYKNSCEASYVMDFPVQMKDRLETAIIRESKIKAHLNGRHVDIPIYLVDNYNYFYRDSMYMYADEAQRFIFWNKAVLKMLPKLNFAPDIIHCNDWQTGAIPFFLKNVYQNDAFYRDISTVFTIHNLQYQGNFSKDNLPYLGVGEEYFTSDRLEFYGGINFMKMGINYSDVLNTVSRTYAREIQTKEKGERLEGLLKKRSNDLYGIINGINYHEFNPKTDKRIYHNYDFTNVANKKDNKYDLQKEMGLPVKDSPMISLISRLVDQKGLDLLAEVVDELMCLDIQCVILGEGDAKYEQMFSNLARRYPQKMGVFIGFNNILAHKIYAGADIFLMPSKFEPCGLGQLIAMRYGTIPIVRGTGGLLDTVHDYNPVINSGNGFVFMDYTGRAFYHSLAKALKLYRDSKDQWKNLMERCMEMDFSWSKSGVEYLQLYAEAINRHSKNEWIA